MYHRLPYVSGGIFGRIDILYRRLPYVSGGVLPFKSLVLYILVLYIPESTIPPILFSFNEF
jgi:hypothetical protein